LTICDRAIAGFVARARRHHGSEEEGPPEFRHHAVVGGAGSVREAQEIAGQIAHRGRIGANTGGGTSKAGAGPPSPNDIELKRVLDVYDKLGEDPPKFKVPKNDDAHEGNGAQTMKRHGYDVPLARAARTTTIEGRLFGDHGWSRPENKSFRWTDPTTMHRTVKRLRQSELGDDPQRFGDDRGSPPHFRRRAPGGRLGGGDR
jgi:hypothetical protein